jgi:lysophospholipase L1-like esterase
MKKLLITILTFTTTISFAQWGNLPVKTYSSDSCIVWNSTAKRQNRTLLPDATKTTRGLLTSADYQKYLSSEEGGVLFSDNFNRSDNANIGVNYSQSGSTLSIFSNKLRMTNTSGSLLWTNKAVLTSIGTSNLENFEVSGTMTVPTLTATTFGASIGFEAGTLPTYGQSFEVRFAMETANSGKIIFCKNQVPSATIPITNPTLLINSGDNTSFRVIINKNEVIVVWKNTTTNMSVTQTLAFELGRTSIVPTAWANTHYVTIFSHGGTIDIDDYVINSTTKKGGIWKLGDSITYGYSAGDISKRTVNVLEKKYEGNFVAFSSANLRVEELTTCAPIIATHLPVEILFAAGVNNIRNGESAATILTKINTFLTTLNGLTGNYYTVGVNFFVCGLVPQYTYNVTAINALLASTFGDGYIDIDSPLRTNATSTPNPDFYNIDGIHPNASGFERMAKTIGTFRNYKTKNKTSENNFVTQQENGYVGIGAYTEVSPQTAIDVIDTKSQARFATVSSNSTDNGMYITARSAAIGAGVISWGSYFDGTNNIAKDVSVSSLIVSRNYTSTAVNAGLTVGSSYTPTEITRTTTTGLGVFNSAPQTPVDIVNANSQLRIATASASVTDNGMYIFARSSAVGAGGVAWGTYFNGTNYIAKDVSTSSFITANGYVNFQVNTGNTVGATFSPTERMRLNTTSLTLSSGIELIGAASQNVFNTISTAVNAFGAATALTIGGTSTSAVTYNLGNNATAGATTKTINIGTGGASGSISNVNLGSATAGATSLITVNGGLKLPSYTVATLPTVIVGVMVYVTDALTPTYNTTVVGGGAEVIPVFYNGTNWICR